MPSLIMETERQKLLNIQKDGVPANLTNADHFCFSCEQIFANRKCLEEHTCSSVSFICSCGTEFTEYNDMLEHSTTHEPGHQVLDHETIRKRRIEKRKEEEEKLERLQKGEVIWKAPGVESVPSVLLPAKSLVQVPNTSAHMSQLPMQSTLISQVPGLFPSMSQASLLPNSAPPSTDMQNIFGDVGAPTVDLWTLYQPVVLINTIRKFNKKKPYTCAKCGQSFVAKSTLVSHHSSHVTDKVSGCIGCGMLLSSKKMVPRFHVCHSPNNTSKFRLITARPLNYKAPSEAGVVRRQNAQFPQTASSKQHPMANSKRGQITHFASRQLNNQNIKTFKNNPGLNVTPALLFKNQNVSTSKRFIGGSFIAKSEKPNLNVPSRSIPGRPTPSPLQMKISTNSTPHMFGKSTLTPSSSGGFTCRVCHIPFDTPQLLQRHKCTKAQEFMARHVRVGKQNHKPKRITPIVNPTLTQINGERRLVPPSTSIKNQVVAVNLDNGQGANGKIEVESDDDCYIVESGPDKPTEMIYQVTSSVPIKT